MQIIEAWPDENGKSSNLDIYLNWNEIERDHCRCRIRDALGSNRIMSLSSRQFKLLERSLERLFAEKSHWQISDQEILGQFELITEHVSPISLETAIESYNKKRKLN